MIVSFYVKNQFYRKVTIRGVKDVQAAVKMAYKECYPYSLKVPAIKAIHKNRFELVGHGLIAKVDG
jgi:hypothetical protein